MSFYRKIDPRVHADRKYRSLSVKGKLLWLTLLTHPSTMSIGTTPVTISGLAEELGWERPALEAELSSLVSLGMLKHDSEERLFFMPNFLKYNPPENPKVVKSLCSWFEKLPDSYLLGEVARAILAAVEGRKEGFDDAVSDRVRGAAETGRRYPEEQTGNGMGYGIRDRLPNRMANQEQEPEQEPKPKPKDSTRRMDDHGGSSTHARTHTHEGACEVGPLDDDEPFPLDEVA